MSLAYLTTIDNKEVDLKKNNIEQGKDFINYEQKCIRKLLPDVKEVQKTSAPFLSSIKEPMQNLTESVKSFKENVQSDLSKDEIEFNKTLAHYASLHNSYFEDQLKPNKNQNNDNYNYIHQQGELLKYNITNNTNNNADVINNSASILNYAGKNVRNAQTGEIAWVDIKGVKHIYSAGMWEDKVRDKDSLCSADVVLLNSDVYNKIPVGSSMMKDSKCSTSISMNPATWMNLNDLSAKLVSLANKISKESNNSTTTHSVYNNQLQQYQSNLSNKINELSQHQQSRSINNLDLTTLEGSYETTNALVIAQYYQYLVWIILTITVLFLLIKLTTLDDELQMVHIILLIVVLFIIYFVSNK